MHLTQLGVQNPSFRSEEELGKYLNRYSLDQIARWVAKLSAARVLHSDELESELRAALPGVSSELVLRPFLLKRILLLAIMHRAQDPSRGADVSIRDLIRLEQELFGLTPKADRARRSNDEVVAVGLRIMQAQYTDNVGLGEWRRRTWADHLVIEEAAARGLDLEKALKDSSGLSYSERSFLGFLVGATFQAHPDRSIDPIELSKKVSSMAIRRGAVEVFFQIAGGSYDDYRGAIDEFRRYVPDHEEYVLSPTVPFPLLRLSNGDSYHPTSTI